MTNDASEPSNGRIVTILVRKDERGFFVYADGMDEDEFGPYQDEETAEEAVAIMKEALLDMGAESVPLPGNFS